MKPKVFKNDDKCMNCGHIRKFRGNFDQLEGDWGKVARMECKCREYYWTRLQSFNRKGL